MMASFQAKIGWERPRKRNRLENSKNRKFKNRKFQKNSKNIQKIQKYHYGFISSQNRLENAENKRK